MSKTCPTPGETRVRAGWCKWLILFAFEAKMGLLGESSFWGNTVVVASLFFRFEMLMPLLLRYTSPSWN
jgi:hypothetical protein